MTKEKVLEVVAIYREQFEKIETCEIDFSYNEHIDPDEPEDDAGALRHCYGMLDSIEQFVREGRMEKAFRWLGFIQGCLWMSGLYTLDELKNHNRQNLAV